MIGWRLGIGYRLRFAIYTLYLHVFFLLYFTFFFSFKALYKEVVTKLCGQFFC